jgi:hypothetical protein
MATTAATKSKFVMRRYLYLLSVIGILAVMTACGYDDNAHVADVNPNEWLPGDTVHITVANADTLSVRNLSLFVRYNSQLRQSALNLHVSTTTPDGTRHSEHFSLHGLSLVHDKNGYGEADALYRSDVVLAQAGNYKFAFTPADTVVGVSAIGVLITPETKHDN